MNKKNIVIIVLLILIGVMSLVATKVVKDSDYNANNTVSSSINSNEINEKTKESNIKENKEKTEDDAIDKEKNDEENEDKNSPEENVEEAAEEITPQAENVSDDKENKNPEVNNKDVQNICSLEIVCHTILNNMDNLEEAKRPFVPGNGVILSTQSIEFTKGETVFDVLKRVCNSRNIQLEYSFTPMYNSYYVEGINQLYEFDCGPQSGWMYKVNNVFPNYGASAYEISNGDAIVFCYTCEGLGKDVGGGF